ncbi:MAG: PPC domain-containing DNA-binding protein [Promethearchaeota archaeon]
MKSIETTVGRAIVGRIMPGEDVLDAITEMVKKHKIKAGFISVIGALNITTIGFFDLDQKQYRFKTFHENIELTSCLGNISYKNGEPVIHLHVSIGMEDHGMKGGHLSRPSRVSVTAEVYIFEINQIITRTHDLEQDAYLLDLN